MKYTLLLVAACALAAPVSPCAAQRFTLDLRPTLAEPLQRFAGSELPTSFGVGATLGVRVLTHLHGYAGWDWMQFDVKQSFAGADNHFEETGYTLGLRFEHPIGLRFVSAWRAEVGGTYKHIEIENADGEIIGDSGHSLGFETAAGLVLPLNHRWLLTPTIRYRDTRNAFALGSVRVDGNLRYIAGEMGLALRF